MIGHVRRRFPQAVPRVLISLLVVAVLGYVLWTVNTLAADVDEAEARAAEARVQRDEQSAKVDALAAQVEALGEKPVVQPDLGPQPLPRPEVSEDRVRAIVAEALLDRRLTLTDWQVDQIARVAASQIPDPERGPPPTEAQVRSVVRDVVADVCSGDACRGADGANGADGADGAPGPGPTDEQVAAAVAAYCSTRNDCRGPQGETGAAGADGKDGRGIESGPDFVRNEDGECVARTTYTDGTTYDSPAGEAACLLQ